MKTKNILIINGHPDPKSFNTAIVNAYIKGVERSNAAYKLITISELNFNPNLQYGYRKRTELEPDLQMAQKQILWAEHIVFVYPVWWGSVPAILKGFLDRVFLPGFAFKKREGSLWWDKCLSGRSARLICTLDQPGWYYRLFNGQPSHIAMKKLVCHFVGIKPVKISTVAPIRLSKESFRTKWLKKVEHLGRKNN